MVLHFAAVLTTPLTKGRGGCGVGGLGLGLTGELGGGGEGFGGGGEGLGGGGWGELWGVSGSDPLSLAGKNPRKNRSLTPS